MRSMLPQNLDAYFLDFDGVVVESADIKTQAFYEIYLPYGQDIAEKALSHHLTYQGVNRYKKFEEIHRKYLGKECDQTEAEELSSKFSELVLKKIIACPFVEGILKFLALQKTQKRPVFLLSATPHEELLAIVRARDIEGFFTGIYGSPWTKETAGKMIIDELDLNPVKIVFVGDSTSDQRAAESLGVYFLGRVPPKSNNPFPGYPVIQSFTEIL